MYKDYTRLKYLEVLENPFIIDRETLQVVLLDRAETPELISAFQNAFADANTFQTKSRSDLEELLSSLDKGPQSYFVNNYENIRPTFSALILPIAAQCNLTCPYCFAQTNKGDFNFIGYKQEDIDRLLAKLHQLNKDTPTTLIFFGGEPLICFDLIEYTLHKVLDYPDMKISSSMTTNGTLITDRRAKFLGENKVAVLLSMDGFDNEYNHRLFRNGRSSVPRVLRAVELLKKHNVSFEIRATLTSDNPYLYDTHKFFQSLEVPYQIAFAYSSENKSHAALSSFSAAIRERIQTDYAKLTDDYRILLEERKTCYDNLLKKIGCAIEGRQLLAQSCSAATNYFTIMANGDIHYCAHLMNNPNYVIGNLYDGFNVDNFRALPFTPKPTNLMSACQDCWAKFLCGGGCTSQKIVDGIPATEPYSTEKCELEKLQYEYYIKLYVMTKLYNEKINNDDVQTRLGIENDRC